MKYLKSSYQLISVITFFSTVFIYLFLGIKYSIWHLNWIIFILLPIVMTIKRGLFSYKIIYPISIFMSVFIINLSAINYELFSNIWIVLIVETMILLTFSGDENIMHIFSLTSIYMVVLAYIGVNVLSSTWIPSLAILFIIPLMIMYSDRWHRRNQINIILFFVFPWIFMILRILDQSSFSFIILPLILLGSFLQGYIFVKVDLKNKNDRIIILYSVCIFLIFCILSIAFNIWLYSSMLFLTIPVIVLIAKGYKSKVTTYFAWLFSVICFIATTIGYALDIYAFSWYYIIILFMLSIITPTKIGKINGQAKI